MNHGSFFQGKDSLQLYRFQFLKMNHLLAETRTQREILGFTDQSFFVKIVFTKILKFS